MFFYTLYLESTYLSLHFFVSEKKKKYQTRISFYKQNTKKRILDFASN